MALTAHARGDPSYSFGYDDRRLVVAGLTALRADRGRNVRHGGIERDFDAVGGGQDHGADVIDRRPSVLEPQR